jgi:hypothetical protein
MLDISLAINPRVGDISLPPFSTGRLSVFQALEGGGNPGELLVTEAAEVTLSFGSVSPGVIVLYNLDDTNFVSWGVATTVYPFRLNPRLTTSSKACPALVTLESGSIFLRADTADCRVLVLGYSK